MNCPLECVEINPTFDVCKRAQCAPYPAYLLLAFDAYLDVLPPEIAQKLSIAAIDGSGQRKHLPLPQNFAPRAPFPADTADTAALEFAGDGSMPLYYAVAEAGFDLRPPSGATASKSSAATWTTTASRSTRFRWARKSLC